LRVNLTHVVRTVPKATAPINPGTGQSLASWCRAFDNERTQATRYCMKERVCHLCADTYYYRVKVPKLTGPLVRPSPQLARSVSVFGNSRSLASDRALGLTAFFSDPKGCHRPLLVFGTPVRHARISQILHISSCVLPCLYAHLPAPVALPCFLHL